MSRLSICIAITWMAVFWPMACLLADGSNGAAGPSGPVSLHFKRSTDGEIVAEHNNASRMVLNTIRREASLD